MIETFAWYYTQHQYRMSGYFTPGSEEFKTCWFAKYAYGKEYYCYAVLDDMKPDLLGWRV